MLTGSSKVKIGVLRNSLEEISCWTKPTDSCPTTNSRYSVRYIPLYVTYSIFVRLFPSRLPRTEDLTRAGHVAGQRGGGQREHFRAKQHHTVQSSRVSIAGRPRASV